MAKETLMIVVSASSRQGKSGSTIKLIDLLYDKLGVIHKASGWTAECLNVRCKNLPMQTYDPITYKGPDRMVVFKKNGEKKIAIVTWGDILEGPVNKCFDRILPDINEYDVIVGCCHPKKDVWNFFIRKVKPLVAIFISLSTYRVVKPQNDENYNDKMNERFVEQLENIVMDKLNGKL